MRNPCHGRLASAALRECEVQHHKARKPAPAATGRELHEISAGRQILVVNTTPEFLQAAVVAELTGSDTCAALGVTAVSATPILVLCRKLIEAGHGPDRPLHAYRGETLCIVVRSIGEASALEINSHGSGFVRLRGRRTAPPAAPVAEARRGRGNSHALAVAVS